MLRIGMRPGRLWGSVLFGLAALAVSGCNTQQGLTDAGAKVQAAAATGAANGAAALDVSQLVLCDGSVRVVQGGANFTYPSPLKIAFKVTNISDTRFEGPIYLVIGPTDPPSFGPAAGDLLPAVTPRDPDGFTNDGRIYYLLPAVQLPAVQFDPGQLLRRSISFDYTPGNRFDLEVHIYAAGDGSV